MQASCCGSEGQTAQLVHLLLPYDPRLHLGLQTAQISVHQLVSSPKPISDVISASTQSVRSVMATGGRKLACLRLSVQLCELPIRQLVHQCSCTRRGERVTWLRCSGRSSGFEPVQSRTCRDRSAQWHGLPGVVVNSCVM